MVLGECFLQINPNEHHDDDLLHSHEEECDDNVNDQSSFVQSESLLNPGEGGIDDISTSHDKIHASSSSSDMGQGNQTLNHLITYDVNNEQKQNCRETFDCRTTSKTNKITKNECPQQISR